MTGKSFFSKSALNVRDRTYSGSESMEMPSLETATKHQLKTSESTDNLFNKFEEEKKPSLSDPTCDTSSGTLIEETTEAKGKLQDVKKLIQNKNPEVNFAPLPKTKKILKATKQSKRKNKKVSNPIVI